MTQTKVFIDENSLASELINESPSVERISQLVEIAEYFLDSENIFKTHCIDDFYSLTIAGVSVSQKMFQDMSNGDLRDLLLRAQVILERSEESTDLQGIATSSFLALTENGSGLWASLTSPINDAKWSQVAMSWVDRKANIAEGLRKIFIHDGYPLASIDQYADHLFPKLYFHAKASDISKTNLEYIEILPKFFSHLSYLNDYGKIHFEKYIQPHELIAAAGSHNVEMSPESPQTHKDKKAMKQRDITIDSIAVCCEWHTKLTKTQGRIHFFASKHKNEAIKKIIDKKIIIGKIVSHLK